MQKPAIALQLGVISFKCLIELILNKDRTFAPKISGGWGIQATRVDFKENEAILSFRARNYPPAPRNIVGVKDNTIFTSEMIRWFFNLLVSSDLSFTFKPEEEVPSSLTESIQSVINQRKEV
ncbi:MAG: hypothetical protein Q7T79_01660 [bacterium]|nr:hypothetical protein [bacterium]